MTGGSYPSLRHTRSIRDRMVALAMWRKFQVTRWWTRFVTAMAMWAASTAALGGTAREGMSSRASCSAFASILFDALRQALHGTRLASATTGTLRRGLPKIGARVTVSVRRVKVAVDSSHPSAAAFARVHARLPG